MTFKSTDFLGAIPAHNGETAYNPGDLVYSPNNFQTYRRKTAAGPGVIVTNKGFESGSSGWSTPQTGCVIESDPTNARTGSWVFRMSRTAGTTASVTESTPRVVALPGQVFRLSGWMKCNALANANASLLVRFARSDGSFLASYSAVFTPAECVSGYVQKTLTATAPALTALVSVQIVDTGMTAGSWWVDDVELVQIEPESDSVNWSPIGNGAPIARTEYTSGTGTHAWNSATNWARVTLVGAGAGGGRPTTSVTGGGGGGGGQTITSTLFPVGALATSCAYVVGAAGNGATANNTAGTDGSDATFGPLSAQGGRGGNAGGSGGIGGGGDNGSNSFGQFPGFTGGGGGAGGASGANPGYGGRAAGFPTGASASVTTGLVSSGGAAGTQAGGGGGGSSPFGRGGNGGAGGGTTGTAGANATGYGGGGGGGGSGTSTSGNGGNGTGGYILIEEFA